jgi:hypothetical protein
MSNLRSKEMLNTSGPISGRRKLYYDFLSSKVLVWSTELAEETRADSEFSVTCVQTQASSGTSLLGRARL